MNGARIAITRGRVALALAIAACGAGAGELPPSGGAFRIDRSTLDGGGGRSQGGVFSPVFREIGVRDGAAGGAGNTLGFQSLVPRQRVRPSPYALHSESVALDSIGTNEIANGSIGSADIDPNAVQRRVAGACPAGQTIRAIGVDGTVTCELASQYAAGNGISAGALSGGTLAIDPVVVPSKLAAAGNQVFGANVLVIDYPNGRIGIANAAPAQRLDVTGNGRFTGTVSASDHLLAAPATGYLATGASNFVQNRANIDDDTYDWNTDVWGTITGTAPLDVRLSAPLYLPVGVDPTSITCDVYDNDATQNLTLSVNVRRQFPGLALTNGDAVAAITTSGASTAIQTATANINANPEDDATISMIATFSVTGASSNLRFYGCRVAYTYTRLGH